MFPHKDLDLASIIIADVPPKSKSKFTDPFKYEPEVGGVESAASMPAASHGASQIEFEPARQHWTYHLGKSHLKDAQNGDAGNLQKTSYYFPSVGFVRSKFFGKPQNSI